MTSLSLGRTRPRTLDEALASPRVAAGLYAALVAATAAPALIWPIPRGNDLVDHWARLTLYHMAPGDPLAALYRVRFGLIPNLGLDALYLALSPLLRRKRSCGSRGCWRSALPASGAWALHRALFKTPSPTIWLVPFLSYNVVTTGGLLNFALGMGLALHALASRAAAPARALSAYLARRCSSAISSPGRAFAGLLTLMLAKTLRGASGGAGARPARANPAAGARRLPAGAAVDLRARRRQADRVAGAGRRDDRRGPDGFGPAPRRLGIGLGQGRAAGAGDAAGARRLRAHGAARAPGAWRGEPDRRAARGLCLVFRAGHRRAVAPARSARPWRRRSPSP